MSTGATNPAPHAHATGTDSDPLLHRPLHRVTFCVLDLETTGTDPGWDDITEVGAILVRGGERLGTFHTLVAPGEVDGVLAALTGFVGDAVVVGHNVDFDLRFLGAALARSERPDLHSPAVVDTMRLARALLRDEVDDHRLGTLAAHFDLEHRPCHRAFEDAAATVDLLHLLIERSWGYGATALDDLLTLPSQAGHRHAAKLRLTAALPRVPGVAVGHDTTGRVVWIDDASDVRAAVRALFHRHAGSTCAAVVRDVAGWHVVEVHDPLARRVARERLLHHHRPRLQRHQTLGDQATYVVLTPRGGGWRATATRSVPDAGRRTVHVLGPLAGRELARHAAAALSRLADAGTPLDEVVDALDAGRAPVRSAATAEPARRDLAPPDAPDAPDPVDAAIARLDDDALGVLAAAHTEVRAARQRGLLDDPQLPAPAVALARPDQPVPLDLLSELLVLARWSGHGAEPHGHAVQPEHEVAAPPRERVVARQLEIVEAAQQLLEQHA